MHQTSPASLFNRLLNHFGSRTSLLLALILLYAVLATLRGCRKGAGETRTTSFVYSFQLMTHCTGTLEMGHVEVLCREGPLHTLGNISELPSSALVHARKSKGPARTSKSLHPSKTAEPPSVLLCAVRTAGNRSVYRYMMFPDQWHINMKISDAQGLKAHQCSSLRSHCCELLSHPSQVPTALPKCDWAHPITSAILLNSALAVPVPVCRNALLDTTGAGQVQSQPSFSILHPHVVNVFTSVIPLTFYIGHSC